ALQREDPQWSILTEYLCNKERSECTRKLSACEKKKCEKLERYFILVDGVLYFKGKNVGLPEHRLRLESKVVALAIWKNLIAIHGVPYRLHSDRGGEFTADNLNAADYEAFSDKLKRVMREGFAFMRDATLDDRLKQKARYDNTRKDAPSIKVGDMVLVRRFTNTRLGYRWSKPLKVKEVTKNGSLYLQDDADPTARLVGPVNIDH
ncbi:hypothetical protein FOL47_003428, partial [Perkinsus chesapeaki]